MKNPTEELTVHILFTLVVGYFAALNMTYFSLHVILNEVKNPTEELTGHILFTLVVGYFAEKVRDDIYSIDLHPPGSLPRLRLAKTIKQPVIASASVAIPLSKVRGIYSDYFSNGLPRHFVPRNDNE